MKHVFSNDMVAHVWAQRSQASGYTSNRNYSFDGAVLLSYSTPIAAFVPGTRKRTACLISERSYSVSTARHISLARRAVSGVPVFVVPHVSIDKWSKPNAKKQHRENLAYLVSEYAALLLTFKRAKTLYSINNEAALADRFIESERIATSYAELFGLKRPSMMPVDDAATLWAYRVARDARTSTPEHAAKLERSRVRREEKKAEEEERKRQANYSYNVDSFVHYMMNENIAYHPASYLFPEGDDVRRYLILAEVARDKALADAWYVTFNAWKEGTGPRPQEIGKGVTYISTEDLKLWQDARDAEKLALRAQQITEWLNGGFAHSLYDLPTMLRIVDGMVQTSRGASFPLAHARRALPLVQHCHDTATAWARVKAGPDDGINTHLGHFTLDAVDAHGNVTAGCHHVLWPEIERFIALLASVPQGESMPHTAWDEVV